MRTKKEEGRRIEKEKENRMKLGNYEKREKYFYKLETNGKVISISSISSEVFQYRDIYE